MNERLNATADVPLATEDRDANLPFALPLELTVHDSETIAELCNYAEGDEREQYAVKALKIGVLALRQARGAIDADAVRRESERMLGSLDSQLDAHAKLMHEKITAVLTHYFDPNSGQFQERVDRLVKQDGELEQVLRRQVGNDDSEICKTLAAHLGVESPLMKLLSPDQSKGLLASLRETFGEQLATQREQVLSQFSLDNKDGALARFIAELTERQGEFSEQLHGRIDDMAKEFSLDEEDSALNRMVRNVDRAQRTITREFSLDEEDSALARLKREMTGLLKEHSETNQKFQEEVKGALQEMVVRKKEADRSTRHGLEFEEALFQQIQAEAQRTGDIATHTGNGTGQIKNCKVGDCVLELGPDSAAPGAKIVVEAKESTGYNVKQACEESETARKNREAQTGLFVFSKKTAPEGIESLTRYGHDIITVWDAEDPQSDLYLRVGLTLARALCVRTREQSTGRNADFSDIDKAILEIEKRTIQLDDIETWTTTIQNNGEKILKKIRTTRKALVKQVETLRERTDDLRESLADEDTGDA